MCKELTLSFSIKNSLYYVTVYHTWSTDTERLRYVQKAYKD